jgi:type III secretory pathway component EscS
MFSGPKIFSYTLNHFDEALNLTLLCCLRSVVTLLGAFAKLQKGTISFVIAVLVSVCLSVRLGQLDSHWTNFHEILYFSTLRQYVKNIQVQL